MQKFSADAFFDIAIILEKFARAKAEGATIKSESKLVVEWLPDLRKRCESIGLRQTAKYVTRMLGELCSGTCKAAKYT